MLKRSEILVDGHGNPKLELLCPTQQNLGLKGFYKGKDTQILDTKPFCVGSLVTLGKP